MATQEQVRGVLQRLQLQGQRIAALERERELKIEGTRAQTAELERSAQIQTLVTIAPRTWWFYGNHKERQRQRKAEQC